MKRWEDWATMQTAATRNYRPTLLGAMLKHRLTNPQPCVEAERDGVPFTPIWWWWNAEADEYVMTLWDTEAGKDRGPPMYSFGASDPLGTFGQPTKMFVGPSVVNMARKLVTVKRKP